MSCHHFIDVSVADWGDQYTCQQLNFVNYSIVQEENSHKIRLLRSIVDNL
jgi:hypothetical protein